MAVLPLPVVLNKSAPSPMTVLLLPVVLEGRAEEPIAVLRAPVLFKNASLPRTVFPFVKQPSRQAARACGESITQTDTSEMNMKARRNRKLSAERFAITVTIVDLNKFIIVDPFPLGG